MNKKPGFTIGSITKRGNLLFSLGMLTIVFILVLPLPTWAIDALLSLSIVQAQYMTLRDLSRNIFYLDRNKLDASTFRQAYWERLFYPISVLALSFCAVPFAFGRTSLRSNL